VSEGIPLPIGVGDLFTYFKAYGIGDCFDFDVFSSAITRIDDIWLETYHSRKAAAPKATPPAKNPRHPR
jgi:hypothetical protein